MNAIPAKDLLQGLQLTLKDHGVDYERFISEFGQVAACEKRQRGEPFLLSEHVRALLLSQLSNQKPWKVIANNLQHIGVVFHGYDPEKLENANPETLAQEIRSVRCGNRAIAKQMLALAENIRTLKWIAVAHGSLDKFVDSDMPYAIACKLHKAGKDNKYKLRHIGPALAMEYLRNVGVRASKPDVHVCRALSGERLGYAAGQPTEEQAVSIMDKLAREAGVNPTYLDNVLWLFCAKDYGNVCGARPKCSACHFRSTCNYPRRMVEAKSQK